MTATDEVQLETEAKARLAPPPRWPPTAIGAGALPLPPRRQQPRATPRRLYLLVYLIRRPGLLKTLATGLMLGAFAAITRLGPHPFSLRRAVRSDAPRPGSRTRYSPLPVLPAEPFGGSCSARPAPS